ncbi:MAG: FG-GAP repeat domain-containing protein [Fimbriiglobus sp.]
MSILSHWLGQPKKRSDAPVMTAQLRVETLEAREVPDATIVTRQPSTDPLLNITDLPADAPVQVLGSSTDGRYLLLQSKATNLVRVQGPAGDFRPQVSAPGQNNIFWMDTQGQAGDSIRLISSYDPPNNAQGFVPGQKGLGAAVSVPGEFLNAVISDDGQTVSFLSGTNAALFDSTLYNSKGFGIDGGGQDCFFWQTSTGRVQLASRTTKGLAIGASGGVTNPSLSPDGKVITFLSDYNAQEIADRTTDNNVLLLFEDDIASPDIFRLDATSAAAVPEPVSVNEVYLPQYSSSVNTTNYAFRMHGIGTRIQVDPLGRYVAAGGGSFIGLRPSSKSQNLDAYRYSYDQTSGGTGIPTKTNPGVYSIDNSAANPTNSGGGFFFGFSRSTGYAASHVLPRIATPTTTNNFFNQVFGFTFQTAVDAGSVSIENAAVALYSGDIIMTYRQNSPISDPLLNPIPGYTPSASAAAGSNDRYDMIEKGFFGSRVGFRLVTRQSGSATQGTGFLDLRPGAYAINPDASSIIFTSNAPANLLVTDADQLGLGAIVDTNRSSDVFHFLGDSTAVISLVSARNSAPNVTGIGASTLPVMTPDGIAIAFQSTVTSDEMSNVPDQNGSLPDIFVRDRVQKDTILASAIPGSISSGDGSSTNAFIVRNGQADLSFYRNFQVFFTSNSSDLDKSVQINKANPQIYQAQFPIFISSLSRNVSYSGGDSGFVSIGRLDNVGNIIETSKFQPFGPAWTGEVRVATADFNNDGVQDIAVAPGPGGGPRVTLIDGFTLRTIDNFFAFESSFRGGIYVGAGDTNNDGIPELIVGAGEGGGPRVQIYNTITGQRTYDQFAYESSSRTGVRVAVGDYNGDGTSDLVIGAGAGGGPRVRVFSGKSLPNQSILADFFAFESSERNGVHVDAGDFDADGKADIAVGTGTGSRPRVIVYNAAYAGLSDPNYAVATAPAANPLRVEVPIKFLDFEPFSPTDDVGARVVLRNIEGGKYAGLVVSTGGQFPVIRTYSGIKRGEDAIGNRLAPLELKEDVPFDALFGTNGAWVG